MSAPIDLIPPELLTSILIQLPIESQVSAIQVCTLWSTILSSPVCQKTRYTTLHDINSSSSSSSSSSLQIQKLLYRHHSPTFSINTRRFVFLTSSITLSPTSQISKPTSFEINIENPLPQDLNSPQDPTFTEHVIPKSHPFLSEPLFLLPQNSSSNNHDNNKMKGFKKIYRIYRLTLFFHKHQKDYITTIPSSFGFLNITSPNASIQEILYGALDEIETLIKGSVGDDLVPHEYAVRFSILPDPTAYEGEYPGVLLKVRVG